MAKLDFEQLTEFCAAILEIQKFPGAKEVLSEYLRIVRLANKGKLTPEGMERFKELNQFIVNAVHEQCQAAKGGAA